MSTRSSCYLCDRGAVKKCDRCGHIFCSSHIGTHSPCAQQDMEEQIKLAHKRRYARVQGAAFEEFHRRSDRCYICDAYAPPEERKLQLASYFRVERDPHTCRGCGRIVCDVHSRITHYKTQFKTSSEEMPQSVRNWTYTRVRANRHCDKCYTFRYVGGRNGMMGIVAFLGAIFGLQVWYGRGLGQGLVIGCATLFVIAMTYVLFLPFKEKDHPPLGNWWRRLEPASQQRPTPTALQQPDLGRSIPEDTSEPAPFRVWGERLGLLSKRELVNPTKPQVETVTSAGTTTAGATQQEQQAGIDPEPSKENPGGSAGIVP